jgi:hypothetical protein
LPVGARYVQIDGDRRLEQAASSLVVAIERLLVGRGDGLARAAVRFGEVTAWFVDENAFVEPGGFWVRGAATTTITISCDARNAPLLVLRNGAAANRVSVSVRRVPEPGAAASWTLALAPAETRELSLPMVGPASDLEIALTSQSGFKPVDVDPASRDTRTLGVWASLR